jgi:Tfp pilus assembly protein PilN
MPIVNLIQEQRNAVRGRESQTRLVLMAIVAAGAVSFLTAGYFTFESVRFNLEIGRLQALKERLQPMMEELERKNQDIAGLQVRRDTLKNAQNDSVRWSTLLAYLGTNTPDGVFMSDFKSALPTDGQSPVGLNITGLSVDQNRVADFMLRLQSSPELEGVSLKYTQEKVGPNNQSTQFELTAALAGSGRAPEDPNAIQEKKS